MASIVRSVVSTARPTLCRPPPPLISSRLRCAHHLATLTQTTLPQPISLLNGAKNELHLRYNSNNVRGVRTQTTSEPPTPPRYVGYWLLGCSALVFSIVVVGGVTRLTESGLSITEWKPITGTLLPSSHDQWLLEYEK